MTTLPAKREGPDAKALIVYGFAVAWGVAMGVLPTRAIYFAGFVWLGLIYGLVLTVLLVDRSRSVALVAVSSGIAFCIFLSVPIHYGHTGARVWGAEEHFWRIFWLALRWFVLWPVCLTWMMKWIVNRAIKWIRGR